jgi:xylulokinase
MPCFLGLDAGTTSLKAALFDEAGRMLAISRQEYTLETPRATWVELDPEVYWTACCRAIREALAASRIPPEEVASICISSQGETFIPVDEHGRPTRRAIVWLDNRAVEEAALIAARFSLEEVYRRTGQPEVAPTWTACKILWLRRNEPEVFASSRKFLLLEDFLLYRLTGQFVTEQALHPSSLLIDLNGGVWWQEMLDFTGVAPERLGQLLPPGEQIGHLTVDGAAAVGLTPGTLAVTGSLDQAIGAVGAGNISPGSVSESTGGALGIVVTVERPILDPQRRLPCYFHAIRDRFCLLPWGQTAGMALRWFRDEFFRREMEEAVHQGSDPYDWMTAEAASVPAGSEGMLVLPHLEGAFSPEYNPRAKAVFFGATLRHRRAHFIRAILESVAFMLRRNLDLVEELNGPAGFTGIREILSTGGGARSPLWLQIKADVLQKPVTRLENEETALLGAAVLGAVATGVYGTPEQAVRQMVRTGHTFLPDPRHAAVYDQVYQKYVDLYARLEGMFEDIESEVKK